MSDIIAFATTAPLANSIISLNPSLISSRTSTSFFSPLSFTNAAATITTTKIDLHNSKTNNNSPHQHQHQHQHHRQPPKAMFTFLREMMAGTQEKIANRVINSGKTAHAVLGNPLVAPNGQWSAPLQQATFGLGCFWGAEKKFWNVDGVYTTSVGYAGGETKNPSYKSVCSGRTNHAEVVNVVFDSTKTSYEKLLDLFWQTHDPTTKNRQGNDVGTQYRSVIFYYSDEQKLLAEQTRDHFNNILKEEGRNACSTEISPAPEYYLAEDYHQQYLHKNPWGYCGLGGTGLYRPPK